MKRMGVAILLASFLICLSACGAKGTNDSVSTDGFAAENVNGMSESKDAVEEDKAEVGKFNFEKRTVMLNSGYEMPIMGLGTYSLSDEECYNSVTALLESGGRLIDTAYMYGNEEAVGAAIRKSGACREDLFVTTKLWVSDSSYEGAKKAFENSLQKLGLEYLDLYLLHQPMGDYYGAWRALEELYKEGRIRAIGVCNFYPHVLADFCETVEVMPMVNQVELHPFFQQPDALSLMKEYEVQPEAWGPFAEGKHGIFTDPVLTQIGEKYGKSAAQVALRWNVQRGVVVIPKSTHKDRMEQNFDIWNFSLTEDEMKAIAPFDIGHSEIVNHFDPNFVRALHGRR